MSDYSGQSDSSDDSEEYYDSEMETSMEGSSLCFDNMCRKVYLDKHIAASKDNSNLDRDIEETLPCDSYLVEQVFSNHLIVKKILSNLSWQDKAMCKQVCSTWHSVANALSRQDLYPIDFNMLVDVYLSSAVLKQSNRFSNEPLAVIIFVDSTVMYDAFDCKLIQPIPCWKPCVYKHSLLDVAVKFSSAPKECLNLISSDFVSYLPAPQSPTFCNAILSLDQTSYLVGLYIPVIPDVAFHCINVHNIKEDFYDIVEEIANDRIFKGLIMYKTDKYHMCYEDEDNFVVQHFIDIQPDIPFAAGGISIDDTMFEQKDVNCLVKYIHKNQRYDCRNAFSVSFFTIPKNTQSNACNFEMFSLVINCRFPNQSDEEEQANMKKCIKEFSEKVPKFSYSAVIALSYKNRYPHHNREHAYFRAVFPNTVLIGCYGNNAFGINHPAKPVSPHSSAKRQCNILINASSVFIYMGWGNILSTPGNT